MPLYPQIAIANALQVHPADVPRLLDLWWKAWEQHPAFDWYYEPDQYGYAPSKDVWTPVVMAVFEHEPGAGGRTESYLVGDVQDCLAPMNIRWGERTLGTFAGLAPILADIPVSRIRTVAVSWSYKGSGGAFCARQWLKALLPRKVHPCISRARRANRRRKSDYLQDPDDPTLYRDKDRWPDWYRKKTKAELFIEHDLSEAERKTISNYMDLMDFWRCATGRVHPDQVQNLVTHQMSLFDDL